MAATGRETWEIVGKSNKKSKPNEKGLSKKEKKTIAENMPRLDVAGKPFLVLKMQKKNVNMFSRSHVEDFRSRCCPKL